jgi:hypothetical protein
MVVERRQREVTLRQFLAMSAVTITLFANSGLAIACDAGRLNGDIDWCLKDANRDGWGDMVTGACNKDASKLRDGFRSCQHDGGIRDNYESCPAGQQIDTARAVANQYHIFQPGKCG